MTAAYLNRLGLRELRRDGGLAATGADEAVGRITGLLAPGEQLEAAYRSTGDLAAAAYDPETKRLYVVRDASAGGNRALVEFLLSHELDHALEDQNFGIGGGRHLTDDGSLARQALIEGLATAVMEDYGAQYLNPLDLLAGSAGIDTGTGDVPQFLVDELTWTYLGGYDYITALRRLAGGWKLVNYALQSRPPASTEQVLHLEKYVNNELPARYESTPPACEADGYKPVDRGDLGELRPRSCSSARRSLPSSPPPAGTATGTSSGAGPSTKIRGCADPCRDGTVLVMRWSWDSARDAAEFERAARGYVADEPRRSATGARGLVAGVDRGRAWLEGTDSAIVFAPSQAVARATATAQLQGSAP